MPVTDKFDVEAARKAGYSDDEILQHLTSTRKFDVDAALRSGYDKSEIIQHLSGTDNTQSTPTSHGASGSFTEPAFQRQDVKFQNFEANHPVASAPFRILNEIGDAGIGAIKGAYHAATDPITDEEKQRLGHFGTPPTNIETIGDRAIAAPMRHEAEIARQRSEQGRPISSALHTAASYVPAIGPMAGSVLNRAESGDVKGAIGETIFDVLAPGITEAGGWAARDFIKHPPLIGDMIERSGVKKANQAMFEKASPELYTPSLNHAADAFGAKASRTKFTDLADNWNIGAEEIKKSAATELPGRRIVTNQDQIHAGEKAMNRIYTGEIEPVIQKVGAQDLTELRDQLKSQAREHGFSESELKRIYRVIDDQLAGVKNGVQIEQLRKKFSAADRVNQANNNYVGAALNKTPNGFITHALNEGTRDFLAGKVKTITGADITDSLRRYGAVTDIVQRAGGIPIDPTVLELLTNRSYITGTAPNLTGRSIEAVTSLWKANDNLIRKAYETYEGPIKPPGPAQSHVVPNQPALPAAGESGGVNSPVLPAQGTYYMSDPVRGLTALNEMRKVSGSSVPNVGRPMQDITARPVTRSRGGTLSLNDQGQRLLPPVTPSGEHQFATPSMPNISERNGQINLPENAPSTQFDRRQITSGTPIRAALPAAPIYFEVPQGTPLKTIKGENMEAPAKIKPPLGTVKGTSDPRLPAHYMEKNWQLDTTPGPHQPADYSGAPTWKTTNPDLARARVKELSNELEKNPKMNQTKRNEIDLERTKLVRQLAEFDRLHKGK